MNHADEDKARNREIAENEAERQTTGDIRVIDLGDRGRRRHRPGRRQLGDGA